MRVTAIKQQVKNSERVSIFVDGKYSFSLSLDELLAEKLKIGTELEEPQLALLKKKSTDGKLKMRALEWVMLRPHSVQEFKDYLRRKKADPDLTEKLIEDFTTKKYLNDMYFAEWWLTRCLLKNKSDRAVRAELRKKGIGVELIDTVLAEDRISEEERIKEIVAKLKTRPRYQDQQKLKAYLVRQGFSYSSVKDVLSEG